MTREVHMRSVAFVLMTPLLACTGYVQGGDSPLPDGATAPDAGGPLPPPAHGFHVTSKPPPDIAPGEESTYCYYFRTSNTDELSVQRWVSRMDPGVHEMILYLTPTDRQTPETISSTNCGIASSNGSPLWTYSAQTPDAHWDLPSNDGAGNPVGQLIRANQPAFLQIHYLNTTGSVIHPQVELNAYAYDNSIPVTLAAPFVTFRSGFQIAPGSEAQPAMAETNGSCPLPVDTTGAPVKFFMMTTHTYRQGVHTSVSDGITTLFDSTSWMLPGATTWSAPFYAFQGTKLGYQCRYLNENTYTIMTGDNPTTDELCMSISFYVPADRGAIGHFCLDNSMVY
ncbi:MAG TPA: hypothetical protein VF516_46430 [Kofleriaceae bacterium]